MQKGDPFSLRPDSRCFVDQLYTGGATAFEHRVEIVNGKADVMDSRAALRHEAAYRRSRVIGFKELDQGLSRLEPHDLRRVRIFQGRFR